MDLFSRKLINTATFVFIGLVLIALSVPSTLPL